MVTAEEVRARVHAVDEQRIELRAERAAEVARDHEQWQAAAAEVARQAAQLQASVERAHEVMTLDELVSFTGLPRTDLPAVAARAKRTAVRAGAARSRRTKSRSRGEDASLTSTANQA